MKKQKWNNAAIGIVGCICIFAIIMVTFYSDEVDGVKEDPTDSINTSDYWDDTNDSLELFFIGKDEKLVWDYPRFEHIVFMGNNKELIRIVYYTAYHVDGYQEGDTIITINVSGEDIGKVIHTEENAKFIIN